MNQEIDRLKNDLENWKDKVQCLEYRLAFRENQVEILRERLGIKTQVFRNKKVLL